jgi:hypothetical protein
VPRFKCLGVGKLEGFDLQSVDPALGKGLTLFDDFSLFGKAHDHDRCAYVKLAVSGTPEAAGTAGSGVIGTFFGLRVIGTSRSISGSFGRSRGNEPNARPIPNSGVTRRCREKPPSNPSKITPFY